MLNIGLMIQSNTKEETVLSMIQLEYSIREAKKKFITDGGNADNWLGVLITVPGCKTELRLRSITDLPFVDRRCPCGNPNHWLVKYSCRK